MQNWEALQTAANYEQQNNWYNTMFAANIKTEPDNNGSSVPTGMTTAHLEHYLKQQQQPMDTIPPMTPSSCNSNANMPQFFDNALTQQQLYQQQFQQAQQAAAQNQMTSAHLPMGFKPLTPPGLPMAVLPSMSHFYNKNNSNEENTNRKNENSELRPSSETTSTLQTILSDNNHADSKSQTAMTPRNTPPMDVTPPKSPKSANQNHGSKKQKQKKVKESSVEKDHEMQSSSSEDIKYMAESEDDDNIRMPIYNSHGKMKNHKCKSCGMIAITKVAFWEHARTHMKPEKILECKKCPFVTELKHHLEYHIRKHTNLKPFQCDKCSYTCVNKSMLNSHRKSHSSVYQFSCADCDYATKYCHSFKLHLRKYEHHPGTVLDEHGVPNPSIVIDVYGTRRGPKNKSSVAPNLGSKRNQDRQQNELKMPPSQLSAALQGFPVGPVSPTNSPSTIAADINQAPKDASSNEAMPNLLPPLASILQQNNNMAFFPYWNLNLQMLAAQQQAVLAQLSPRMRETALQQLQFQGNDSAEEDDDNEDESSETEQQVEHFESKSVDSAMDLSRATPNHEEKKSDITPLKVMNLKLLTTETSETPLMVDAAMAKRKGRVLKLETKSPVQEVTTNNDGSIMQVASSPITASAFPKLDANISTDESMELSSTTNTAVANTNQISTTSTPSSSGNSSNGSNTSSNSNSNSSTLHVSPTAAGAIYECKYCDIFFKDAVLYTIHMGYHSCDDVFKCNMCGEKCDGPVGLFVHMARNAHS